MTFFHILNFAIPIASMIGLGFLLDRMCKPDKEAKKVPTE